MTAREFAPILKFLEAGCGMREPVTAEQTAAYLELLADLPAETVRAGAKVVLLDHLYPTLPPVGRIRHAALALSRPPARQPDEAWGLLVAAVRRFGRQRKTEGLASLPADVAAIACDGFWDPLCECRDEHLAFERNKFCECFERRSKAAAERLALPPSVRAIAAGFADAIDIRTALEPSPAPRRLSA